MAALSSAIEPYMITSLAIILLTTHALKERKQIVQKCREVLDFALEINYDCDPVRSLMDEKRLQYAMCILDYTLILLAADLSVFLALCCLLDMTESYAVALVWCTIYAMLLWVQFSGIEPTLGLLSAVCSGIHVILLIRVIHISFTSLDIHNVAAGATLRVLSRGMLGVATLDKRRTMLWSVAHTIVNMWAHKQRDFTAMILFSELTISAAIMGIVSIVEELTRHQILAACSVESLSSEKDSLNSEKATVMRLLSAFCDAKVQLNADFRIQGDHKQLAQLLKSKSPGCLDNLDFTAHLSPGDDTRVRDFVKVSSIGKQANQGAEPELEPPISLQVQLQDSAGIFFKARLYSVSSRHASGEQFHLIGICEESSEPRQEAFSEVLLEELRFAEAQRTERARTRQSSASSSSSASSKHSTLYEATAVDVVELDSLQIRLDPLTTGFPIGSCTIKFAEEAYELSPSLKDWVYEKDFKALSDWLQARVNSFYTHGTYRTDPFPNLRLYQPGTMTTRTLFLAEQTRFVTLYPEGGSKCDGSYVEDGDSGTSDSSEWVLQLTGIKRIQAEPRNVRALHHSSRQAALPSIQEGA
eukprot:TRINITY_DN11476_c0_g2_i3.p1 TRINITY_DN11476_c0_g2~~TRINITY_DN11476_c0_g2_i3.p1  ORF type:complete len:586 (-),score=86.96 TRINITY_DN11476_c0_g2_i3:81-1838(-)